jgi:phosphocarrier protein
LSINHHGSPRSRERQEVFSASRDNALVERKIQVTNKLGLHARPAAMLVQKASKFKSEIRLKKEDVEANAKSILSVMMLAAEVGSYVIIKAQGEDEQEAAEAMAKLFEDKFGEE